MDNRQVIVNKKANVRYIDEEFFNKWSPEMAYILGFFAADGCLTENRKRGNKYIEFVSTDLEIIEKIKEVLQSEHSIGVKEPKGNCKTGYRLQIGSKRMFGSLLDLGFTVNKSLTIAFPTLPRKYFSHFVRGYYDGDGCISFGFYKPKSRNRRKYLITRFTSGNKEFLIQLSKGLSRYFKVKNGSIFSGMHTGYHLAYSKEDSLTILQNIYKNNHNLFLMRKYNIYLNALNSYGVVA